MPETLMVLPAAKPADTCLLRIPPDTGKEEAFRNVTALIAAVQEQDPDCPLEDLLAELEDRGYQAVEFILGPTLD